MSMTGCTGGFMSDPNSEYYIPDGSIQASSESGYYKASKGRLHGRPAGWLPDYDDTQKWIQADIGRLVNMYGIRTQGHNIESPYWVTTLKVSTFQNVPGTGDVGDFIQEGSDVKVCNHQTKQLTFN